MTPQVLKYYGLTFEGLFAFYNEAQIIQLSRMGLLFAKSGDHEVLLFPKNDAKWSNILSKESSVISVVVLSVIFNLSTLPPRPN